MCCHISWCKKNLANCKILLHILTVYKENHWLVEVVRHYWRSLSQASTGHHSEQGTQLFRAGYTWDSVGVFEDIWGYLRTPLFFSFLFYGISCISICFCWATLEKYGSISVFNSFSYTLVRYSHVFFRLNSLGSLSLSWYVRNFKRWFFIWEVCEVWLSI